MARSEGCSQERQQIHRDNARKPVPCAASDDRSQPMREARANRQSRAIGNNIGKDREHDSRRIASESRSQQPRHQHPLVACLVAVSCDHEQMIDSSERRHADKLAQVVAQVVAHALH